MGWPSLARNWSTFELALNIVGMIFHSLPLWLRLTFRRVTLSSAHQPEFPFSNRASDSHRHQVFANGSLSLFFTARGLFCGDLVQHLVGKPAHIPAR